MKAPRTTVFVLLTMLAMLLAPPAVAHHRPDHQTGKPSPSPSPTPTPTPVPPKPVNVTLEINVDLDYRAETETKSCNLSVLEGSNRLTILQAAVDAGCIRSFEVTSWNYLRCVDDLCNRQEYAAYITTGFNWEAGGNLMEGSASEGSVMKATYVGYAYYSMPCC